MTVMMEGRGETGGGGEAGSRAQIAAARGPLG